MSDWASDGVGRESEEEDGMRLFTRSVFELEELYVRVGVAMSRGFPAVTPRARREVAEELRRVKAESYALTGLPAHDCVLGQARLPAVWDAWDSVPPFDPDDADNYRWCGARTAWSRELLRWAREADPAESIPVWEPPK